MLVHKKYLRSPKDKDFAWKETIATMLKVTPPWQSDDGHAEKGMIWSQYYNKTIHSGTWGYEGSKSKCLKSSYMMMFQLKLVILDQ